MVIDGINYAHSLTGATQTGATNAQKAATLDSIVKNQELARVSDAGKQEGVQEGAQQMLAELVGLASSAVPYTPAYTVASDTGRRYEDAGLYQQGLDQHVPAVTPEMLRGATQGARLQPDNRDAMTPEAAAYLKAIRERKANDQAYQYQAR